MKKVIKLKESDLVNLVKGILNEQPNRDELKKAVQSIKVDNANVNRTLTDNNPNINDLTGKLGGGFDEYAIQRFTEDGFKKVSNTLYKKDVSTGKTLKVSYYAKGCSEKYPGFTFFVNDKPIYQGCPDDCWVWWKKYNVLFN